MNKKILIVEDDVIISEQLNDIVLDLGYEVTDLAEDTETALESMQNTVPDLAILDIKMHGKEQGFEIAEYINKNYDFPFIFLTSFSDADTVKKASKLQPSAYLLKPFNSNDIFSTIEVALNSYQAQNHYIILKDGRKTIKLNIDDILWVNSSDVYIEIHTKTKKYLQRDSLDTFFNSYKDLKPSWLIRAHRSYAVNMQYVNTVESKFVFIGDKKVPLSRTYKDQFSNLFNDKY